MFKLFLFFLNMKLCYLLLREKCVLFDINNIFNSFIIIKKVIGNNNIFQNFLIFVDLNLTFLFVTIKKLLL